MSVSALTHGFRLVSPLFSSWRKCTPARSPLVGCCLRVATRMRTSPSSASVTALSRPLVTSTVSTEGFVTRTPVLTFPSDIHVQLEAEAETFEGRNRFIELFTVPRNRRATLASFIVMFMQQFCGVNVIAYYSSTVLSQSGFTDLQALIASWGFGMLNWVFAFPAVWTIDTFGRRNLLLTTFPLMAIFLLMTGFSFYIPEGKGRLAVVALGIYLYTMAYSPGEGPVPFTYSAEAFPLYVRDVGMSFATAVLWFL